MLTNRFKRGAFAFALIAMFLSGCRTSVSEVSVPARIGGTLSLNIPGGFRQVGDLHDHADFQFENREESLFLVGISDSRKSIARLIPRFTLKDYSDFVLRNLRSGMEKSWLASSITKSFEGNPVSIFELRGNKPEGGMTCTVGIMERQGTFFQLVAWGPDDKSDKVCALVNDLIASAAAAERSAGGSEAQGAEPASN